MFFGSLQGCIHGVFLKSIAKLRTQTQRENGTSIWLGMLGPSRLRSLTQPTTHSLSLTFLERGALFQPQNYLEQQVNRFLDRVYFPELRPIPGLYLAG